MEIVICRAELHGTPTREQYSAFHAGMEQLGFGQTITRDGRDFRLPTGEYLGANLSTSLTLLALKITHLAFQITGCPCKLTLAPVDVANIYFLCLEEVSSYASELGIGISAFGSFAASTGL
ncbi:MAG: hypothetical protein WBS24_18710 [Terriglobales bacterium]